MTDGHGHHHTSSHDHFIEIPIEVLLGEIGMHKLLKYAIKDEKSKVEVECAKLEKTHEHHQKSHAPDIFHAKTFNIKDLIPEAWFEGVDLKARCEKGLYGMEEDTANDFLTNWKAALQEGTGHTTTLILEAILTRKSPFIASAIKTLQDHMTSLQKHFKAQTFDEHAATVTLHSRVHAFVDSQRTSVNKRVLKHQEAIAANKIQSEKHKMHRENHNKSLDDLEIKIKEANEIELRNAQQLASFEERLPELRTFLTDCRILVTGSQNALDAHIATDPREKFSDARKKRLDAFSAVNLKVLKSHGELKAKREQLHALGEIQASLMEKESDLLAHHAGIVKRLKYKQDEVDRMPKHEHFFPTNASVMHDQLNHSLRNRDLKEIPKVRYGTTPDEWFEHLLKGIPTAYVKEITSRLADLNRKMQAVADRIIELESIIPDLESQRTKEQSTYESDIADASTQEHHNMRHQKLHQKLSDAKKLVEDCEKTIAELEEKKKTISEHPNEGNRHGKQKRQILASLSQVTKDLAKVAIEESGNLELLKSAQAELQDHKQRVQKALTDLEAARSKQAEAQKRKTHHIHELTRVALRLCQMKSLKDFIDCHPKMTGFFGDDQLDDVYKKAASAIIFGRCADRACKIDVMHVPVVTQVQTKTSDSEHKSSYEDYSLRIVEKYCELVDCNFPGRHPEQSWRLHPAMKDVAKHIAKVEGGELERYYREVEIHLGDDPSKVKLKDYWAALQLPEHELELSFIGHYDDEAYRFSAFEIFSVDKKITAQLFYRPRRHATLVLQMGRVHSEILPEEHLHILEE